METEPIQMEPKEIKSRRTNQQTNYYFFLLTQHPHGVISSKQTNKPNNKSHIENR
jgi:hypothetical protein